MSSNLYKIREQNVWKTWVLMAGFLILVVPIGWFLSYYYGSPNILYVAVIFSLLMNFVSYWFSDKIVLRISGARKASKEEYYDLYTITENLSITSGLPMPKLYVIHDISPNAFATGRNEKHAVVAVTTGLLAILEKNELEGVVAHELAHIKNRDILLQSVIVVLVGLIAIVSDVFLRSTMFKHTDSRDSKAGVILIIVGVALMILSPIIATVIQLAVSRKREFMADATGALMTRYPEGLANALRKISKSSLPLKKASHATAHLYIADPYKDKESGIRNQESGKRKTGFFHKMFMTHPPVEERIMALTGKQ